MSYARLSLVFATQAMSTVQDEFQVINSSPERREKNLRLSKQNLWLNSFLSFLTWGAIWLAIRQKKWNYLYAMAGSQAIAIVLIMSSDNVAIIRHARTVARLATAAYCIPRIISSKKEALEIEELLSRIN